MADDRPLVRGQAKAQKSLCVLDTAGIQGAGVQDAADEGDGPDEFKLQAHLAFHHASRVISIHQWGDFEVHSSLTCTGTTE